MNLQLNSTVVLFFLISFSSSTPSLLCDSDELRLANCPPPHEICLVPPHSSPECVSVHSISLCSPAPVHSTCDGFTCSYVSERALLSFCSELAPTGPPCELTSSHSTCERDYEYCIPFSSLPTGISYNCVSFPPSPKLRALQCALSQYELNSSCQGNNPFTRLRLS